MTSPYHMLCDWYGPRWTRRGLTMELTFRRLVVHIGFGRLCVAVGGDA